MATLVIIKNSKVAGDIPTTLASGELAINVVDGKLFYGDINGTVHQLSSGGGSGVTKIIAGTNISISPTSGTGSVTINATATSTTPGGSTQQIQYNNGGSFGGVPNLIWNGSTLSATGSFSGSLIGSASYATTASYINGGTF
jgi:hypothetical protein